MGGVGLVAVLLGAGPLVGSMRSVGAEEKSRLVRELMPDAPRSWFGGCDRGSFAVAASPDGHWIATGHGQSVRLWDAKSGELAWQESQRGTVHAVAFSPDGRRLAWNIWGRAFSVIDIETRTHRIAPEGGIVVGFFLDFTPDGRYLLAQGPMGRGARHQETILWDLERVEPVHRIRTPGTTSKGRISPDGRTFAVATNRSCARIFDRGTGEELHAVRVRGGSVLDLAYSPSGDRLAVVSSWPHPSVDIVEVGSGRLVRRLDCEEVVRAIAWSPDGRFAATGENGATLTYRSVEAKGRDVSWRGNPGGTSALTFDAAGRLVSTSFHGRVAIWREPPSE